MATTDPLPDSTRKAIAVQTHDFLQALTRFKTPAPKAGTRDATKAAVVTNPKLAEAFAYCSVSLTAVESPPADLPTLLEPTGTWLHTIRNGKETTHYALSRAGSFDPDHHEVLSLVGGPLGQKIDATIKWLDKHDQDDTAIVRILAFPAYYIHAFGILRGGKAFAVLIDQPESSGKLEYEKEYPLKEFLTKLAKEPHS